MLFVFSSAHISLYSDCNVCWHCIFFYSLLNIVEINKSIIRFDTARQKRKTSTTRAFSVANGFQIYFVRLTIIGVRMGIEDCIPRIPQRNNPSCERYREMMMMIFPDTRHPNPYIEHDIWRSSHWAVLSTNLHSMVLERVRQDKIGEHRQRMRFIQHEQPFFRNNERLHFMFLTGERSCVLSHSDKGLGVHEGRRERGSILEWHAIQGVWRMVPWQFLCLAGNSNSFSLYQSVTRSLLSPVQTGTRILNISYVVGIMSKCRCFFTWKQSFSCSQNPCIPSHLI